MGIPGDRSRIDSGATQARVGSFVGTGSRTTADDSNIHHQRQDRITESRTRRVGNHFGKAEDYLDNFTRFITEHANDIPALITVLQKPRELTHKELKALAVALDAKGFKEKDLDAAWQAKTNHEIAAGILGYIRQAALGDALVPFAERVDKAIAAIEAKHRFSPVQKQWLSKLAKQLKSNFVLDRETLDTGALQKDGGFKRIDKIFDGGWIPCLQNLMRHYGQNKPDGL